MPTNEKTMKMLFGDATQVDVAATSRKSGNWPNPNEVANTANYLKAVQANLNQALNKLIVGVQGWNVQPKKGTAIGKKLENILKQI